MRIVHYINQFFGQIGSESEAYYPLEVREGVVGPGMALKSELGSKAEIVATIICGDNYFVENTEVVSKQIRDILKSYKADLFVAGPAFNAGRYGVACGSACKIAYEELGIEAISGMYKENPGVEMFRRYAYMVPTVDSARGMRDAVKKMATLIKRLADGEIIDDPEEDGYFQRGIRKSFFSEYTGAKRCVDMMLDKVYGRPYKTELPMPNFKKVTPAPSIKNLKNAKIALMTTGGLVPKGNPDKLEASAATKFVKYSYDDYGGMDIPNSETCHGGYDPVYVNESGKRLLPIDALVELQKEGLIGKIHDYVYVTTGTAMPTDRAKTFGTEIAKQFREADVDGVILTST